MKNIQLMTAGLAMIMFTACNKSDFEGYTKAESGLHYKFFTQNEDAAKANEGEGITIRYTLKLKNKDTLFFDSKMSSPDGNNRLMLMKSTTHGGIEDALKMMAKGDSAEFIFSADSFFLKTNQMTELPPFVKAKDNIVFSVKMVDIRSKKEIEENQKMQMAEQEAKMKLMQEKEKTDLEKYLADNKITAKPLPSGLIYIETKKGSGAKPDSNSVVKVHYHGTRLDGTVFDSSVERGEPYETSLGGVIRGWTIAVPMMKKGGKARIIVPSELAYGPYGQGERIPPFTTLVFDLELVDVLPAGTQPKMPGQ